jgi:hypothetical protein
MFGRTSASVSRCRGRGVEPQVVVIRDRHEVDTRFESALLGEDGQLDEPARRV